MEHASNYSHKKFSTEKRKREMDEHPMTTADQLPAKRQQGQAFFRPWLDSKTDKPLSQTPADVPQYHANMVRSQTPRLRSPQAQERRDRNTRACLLYRRAKHTQEAIMEQQCVEYRAQHAAMLDQQLRLSFYYRQLLQQAVFQRAVAGFPLPQQQQQFLQQMALSQQLLIFGATR
ncbi:protein Mabiki [Scaptodrosophila lebanonensis]|uniref:Protein Mabiki n=1 Tax=Drosophila lebanonensis TaxID=7225 RepID=A0A6J2TNU7_DROLE|nr:protein Mabiki [Scaptodrosophila lebanonensis]